LFFQNFPESWLVLASTSDDRRMDNGGIDSVRSRLQIQGLAIDEVQFELCRRANVNHRDPYHGGFGETGREESEDGRNGVLLASKGGHEQSDGVRRPREDESTCRKDDA
jgi:hypothetical protein